MPLQRVYLPATAAAVGALHATGVLGPAPLRAHTVTGTVSRGAFGGDEEDQEYAAWLAAAADARTLVGERGRRVVVSADVDSTLLESELPEDRDARANDAGPAPETSVRVTSAIPLKRIVSFHLDEQPGGGDADLLWFDVTEINEVVGALDA